MKLTTHLQLMLKLRMVELYLDFRTPLLSDASLIKPVGNFIFAFTYLNFSRQMS
jgi:hypothetical protein